MVTKKQETAGRRRVKPSPSSEEASERIIEYLNPGETAIPAEANRRIAEIIDETIADHRKMAAFRTRENLNCPAYGKGMPPNGEPPPVPSQGVPRFMLPLDLALIRWSVKCEAWGELAAGNAPLLGAFLAGWYCRSICASKPVQPGQYRDSFQAGWGEADAQIAIEDNRRNHQVSLEPKPTE